MRGQLLTATFLCVFALTAGAAPAARQQAAAPTTPFNTQNSTQVFQMSQSGGIQQLTAKDSRDQSLTAAIRTYIEAEAERFGKGDYGKSPRVRFLRAVKPGQIAITYREVPAGAAVDYVGRDAAAVDAIHKWLDAEISEQE